MNESSENSNNFIYITLLLHIQIHTTLVDKAIIINCIFLSLTFFPASGRGRTARGMVAAWEGALAWRQRGPEAPRLPVLRRACAWSARALPAPRPWAAPQGRAPSARPSEAPEARRTRRWRRRLLLQQQRLAPPAAAAAAAAAAASSTGWAAAGTRTGWAARRDWAPQLQQQQASDDGGGDGGWEGEGERAAWRDLRRKRRAPGLGGPEKMLLMWMFQIEKPTLSKYYSHLNFLLNWKLKVVECDF